MTYKEIKQELQDSAMVLVGIGEELKGDLETFYQKLAELLGQRNYFVVTLQDREGLERAGVLPDRITAPLYDEEQESWEKYLRWLGFTLNQKLCVLELGVGFRYPDVIRFPFEKTSYFNQKSKYIRVNERFWQLSEEIADRGMSVKADAVKLLMEEA